MKKLFFSLFLLFSLGAKSQVCPSGYILYYSDDFNYSNTGGNDNKYSGSTINSMLDAGWVGDLKDHNTATDIKMKPQNGNWGVTNNHRDDNKSLSNNTGAFGPNGYSASDTSTHYYLVFNANGADNNTGHQDKELYFPK
jgi:hypothetical protein